MNRLFIVRHGRTFRPGEPPRRIGARTDVPLVAEGEAEAAALGRFFAMEQISFSAAFTGPLQRARHTATIILDYQRDRPRLQVRDWLQEIDHGVDEGMLEDEVVRRLGDENISAWNNHAVAPTEWIVDAPSRLCGWSRLFADHGEGTALAVTSNGAARYAMLAIPTPAKGPLKLGTGCYAELILDGGEWTVVCWNRRP